MINVETAQARALVSSVSVAVASGSAGPPASSAGLRLSQAQKQQREVQAAEGHRQHQQPRQLRAGHAGEGNDERGDQHEAQCHQHQWGHVVHADLDDNDVEGPDDDDRQAEQEIAKGHGLSL